MTHWMDTLAGNSPSDWATSGAVFCALIGAAWLARFVAVRYLSAYAGRTQTKIDDVLLLLVKKSHLAILVVIAVLVSTRVLALPEELSKLFRMAAVACAFLQVALWGNAVISFTLTEAIRRAGTQDTNISARRAMAYLGRFVLWLLVFALLLENLGVRLTPLLAGIGIGGIAIALAIQSTLGDLFCYAAIILDKPFIAGDFLVIDDFMGTVERIGLKTTRIRSLSGELLIFANHDLVNSRVRNYKTLQERRVQFRFGVTYETAIDRLKKIPDLVRGLFEKLPGARLDRVHFASLGDFSLTYEVVYYVVSGDYTAYMTLQQEVNLLLMQSLEQEKIAFAYPTQTLLVRSEPSAHQ